MFEDIFILSISILILVIILTTFILTYKIQKKCIKQINKEHFVMLPRKNHPSYKHGLSTYRANILSTINVKKNLSCSSNLPFRNYILTSENSDNKKDNQDKDRSTKINSKNAYIDKLHFNNFDNDTKLKILDILYPIGSIYITVNKGSTGKKPFDVGNWTLYNQNVYLCNIDGKNTEYVPNSQLLVSDGASVKMNKNNMPLHSHTLQAQITLPSAGGAGLGHSHQVLLPKPFTNDEFNSYYSNGKSREYAVLKPTDMHFVDMKSSGREQGLITSYNHENNDKNGNKMSVTLDENSNLIDYVTPEPNQSEQDLVKNRFWKTTVNGGHTHKLLYTDSKGGSSTSTETGYSADPEITIEENSTISQKPFLPSYICVCVWKRYG